MEKIALALIYIYKKFIANLWMRIFGGGCRFSPSCSDYASQAIKKWGFWKGSRQALLRILRCHPFGSFGYDPVS